MKPDNKHLRMDWGVNSDFELLAIEASIQPYRMAVALERALKLPVELAKPYRSLIDKPSKLALTTDELPPSNLSKPSNQPIVLPIPAFGATLNTALSPSAPKEITGMPSESLHIRYLVKLPEDEQSGELMLLCNQGSRQLLFPKLRTTAFLLKVVDVSKDFALNTLQKALENQPWIENVRELDRAEIKLMKHLDAFYLE
jgi:hypothetical protein